MKNLILFLLCLFLVDSALSQVTTDTAYINLMKRLNRTVPYRLTIGGGTTYRSYFNTESFQRLWDELVPERKGEGLAPKSRLGLDIEISTRFFDNLALGVFFHQTIQSISSEFTKTSNGENVEYFNKPYYIPPGTHNMYNELTLTSLHMGGLARYFPMKRGSLGISFLTPFIELGYGITLVRGKFTSNPFYGEIERFRRTNPVYFTGAVGAFLSSRSSWSGVSLKIRTVYATLSRVDTFESGTITYDNGEDYKADLSHFGLSLMVQFIFH